jgi:pimeloyl-ACP methyl ester carboxylesterase
MRDTTLSRRDMLWAAGALTVGATFAEPAKVAASERSGAGPEPTSWVDSAMPEVTHRMIETNGIRMHVAEQGSGPLVILCHGFRECWYSWRHQLPALAKAGFRAVAPDLRGYGRSDRPEEVEKYTILHDIGDIVGLVDALGAKQAVIAGHDIGAAIAWQTALLRPDRFRAVIALSPPFRSRGFGDSGPPTTLMPRTENTVFYQLFLQNPAAEAGLGRDLHLTFRYQFYTLSGDRPSSAVLAGLGHGVRHRCLRQGIRAERIPWAPRLVAQHRSQLGAAGTLCRSGSDHSRAIHGGRPGFCRRRFLPGHREAIGTGPQAPVNDYAA